LREGNMPARRSGRSDSALRRGGPSAPLIPARAARLKGDRRRFGLGAMRGGACSTSPAQHTAYAGESRVPFLGARSRQISVASFVALRLCAIEP